MKKLTRSKFLVMSLIAGCFTSAVIAQGPRRSGRGGGPPTPGNMGSAPAAPVEPGEAGIAWYGSWEVAAKEARRSNRPIMYMAATAQCTGVPGVF